MADVKMTPEKRKKMEDLIYKFFTAIDKSGTNTKKYKDQFQDMSDNQFNEFFKAFFADEKAYLVLDICDYEHTLTLEDIERGAKVLNIPLFEHVYCPHYTMDRTNVIRTQEKVPVGYIHLKRTQQTILKKNGMSTNINQRSGITGQVTGHDKNGRESDLENTMLIALGMTNTLKELNGPRADDMVMKQEMLNDISLNGYTKLQNMTDDISNKTTLNTVDVYITGMSLSSDLTSPGLMTRSNMMK